MYQLTVPSINWFEYQTWMTQNYMYPVVNYYAYPEAWNLMIIDFIRETDRDRFEERWKHTLD